MKIAWDSPDIGFDEIQAASKSLSKGIGAKGGSVVELEEIFKDKLGCKDAILVNNGTSALLASHLAMRNKYPEIETIGIPSFTFIASLFSSSLVFNQFKLLDCNIDDWNIGVNTVNPEVDLTLLVDVGGVPCDYDEFKKAENLIFADSAESLGSLYKGKIVGSQLPIHTFSFQRSKIITCGEGGLIAVNDDEMSDYLRAVINHGYSSRKKDYEYVHDQFGLNFRMCDVEAAILRVQLSKLDTYLSNREAVAEYYRKNLNPNFIIQQTPVHAKTNNFFFGILVEADIREKFVVYLLEKGISVKCWSAIHEQKNMPSAELPNASIISRRNVLLPIHNRLTFEETEYIVNACNSF